METIMDEKPDAGTLLQSFIDGDASTFPEVVRTLRSRLTHYAYAVISDWDAAKDAVQEAFTKLYRVGRSIRENPMAWLFKVTRNQCIDQIRQRKRRGEERLGGAIHISSRGSLPPDLTLQVREAMDVLSERDRAVVLLKVVEGLSYQEIAQSMDLSVSNVGYILHHGLKRMASHLGQGGQS
mgnify:CR=1 FL=1